MYDERSFIDQDSSGNWYVIPERYRDEWQEWYYSAEDDEYASEPPTFAYALSGRPSQVVFGEDWEIKQD